MSLLIYTHTVLNELSISMIKGKLVNWIQCRNINKWWCRISKWEQEKTRSNSTEKWLDHEHILIISEVSRTMDVFYVCFKNWENTFIIEIRISASIFHSTFPLFNSLKRFFRSAAARNIQKFCLDPFFAHSLRLFSRGFLHHHLLKISEAWSNINFINYTCSYIFRFRFTST